MEPFQQQRFDEIKSHLANRPPIVLCEIICGSYAVAAAIADDWQGQAIVLCDTVTQKGYLTKRLKKVRAYLRNEMPAADMIVHMSVGTAHLGSPAIRVVFSQQLVPTQHVLRITPFSPAESAAGGFISAKMLKLLEPFWYAAVSAPAAHAVHPAV